MTDQEMADALLAIQGFDHELERQLHEAHVARVGLFKGSEETISRSYIVFLDSGHACIFKAGNSLLEPTSSGLHLGAQALKNYNHRPFTTTIAECASWQLAKQLGPPWSEIVVPCVLKFARLPAGGMESGAASLFRAGEAGKRGFYEVVPDQVAAAAFFDALTGQQDRNRGNVLWYEDRRRIYLIDHSFSLARPGENHGESRLLEWRRTHGNDRLSPQEVEALERLLASDDLLTLRRFIEADRANAIEQRAKRMLDSGRVIPGF